MNAKTKVVFMMLMFCGLMLTLVLYLGEISFYIVFKCCIVYGCLFLWVCPAAGEDPVSIANCFVQMGLPYKRNANFSRLHNDLKKAN